MYGHAVAARCEGPRHLEKRDVEGKRIRKNK